MPEKEVSKEKPQVKLFGMIVSRVESSTVQHDWYFSFDFTHRKLYVTGYRKYLFVNGEWCISERYYPNYATSLPGMINLDKVPLPEDVQAEAIKRFCADIVCCKTV